VGRGEGKESQTINGSGAPTDFSRKSNRSYLSGEIEDIAAPFGNYSNPICRFFWKI